MPWYVVVFIAYIVIARLASIALINQYIKLSPGLVITSMITGALMIWAMLAALGAH